MCIRSCKHPTYSHNQLALNCIPDVTRAQFKTVFDPIQSDYIEAVPTTILGPTSPIIIFVHGEIPSDSNVTFVSFLRRIARREFGRYSERITKSRKWGNNYLQ